MKCSFYMFFYTFRLRETNDFVLTSLKVATQIPPPPTALEIFKYVLTQNMFYFKMSYESTQKVYQCCIYCPSRYILKPSEWILLS